MDRIGWRAWVVGSVLALALAGCGGNERTVETGDGTITAEQDGEQVRIEGKTEEGRGYEGRFGEDVELPDDFPADVPIYPGARVQGTMLAEGNRMVTLATSDAAAKVAAFYEERLGASGWEAAARMDMGGSRMLSFQKGERTATVQLFEEAESGTRIMLMTGDRG